VRELAEFPAIDGMYIRSCTKTWILYGNINESGDVRQYPEKSSLFFLTCYHYGLYTDGVTEKDSDTSYWIEGEAFEGVL
jgi:hypothetical protein